MKLKHSLSQSLLLAASLSLASAALAQKSGGTLRVPLTSNPGSASLHEESSIGAQRPFMPVFNNLVLFDQHEKIARPESIRPELATAWSWNADNTVLTLKLREGVKWHDGKPFTSADVQCTWEMIQEKRPNNWRKNTHKEWYSNLKEVTATGPYEVRFTLARPQPSFLSLLASGWSPVYPCHVDGRVMRQKPIGTGPFKVAEFKASEVVRLVKNHDYWRPGRPYLDAIEWRVMPSHATRNLSFLVGDFDLTASGDVTTNSLKTVRAQLPKAVCETTYTNSNGYLLMNHKMPPFDNVNVRRAISLALDRREFVRATQGDGRIGGIMMSPPDGSWGLTPEQLAAVPGFGKDVERNREEARKLMAEAGYGPKNKLKVSYMVRMTSPLFLAAVSVLADQLRNIYIEGDVEQKEYSLLTAALVKGAYTMAFETMGTAIDDPDVTFYEGFSCGSVRNYSKYCNREVEARIHEQSATLDPVKRKQLVQALELMIHKDVARAILYQQINTSCWQPYLKGYVRATNGIYTHNRMEDVWLDK